MESRSGEGYHVVPPPYTCKGLDDSVFKSAISESITSVHETETSTSKTSKESKEKPKIVRPSAPIIKDWESDSDDDCEIRPSIEQNKHSHAKINFVKSDENIRKYVIEQHTYKQAENLRKRQNSRVDKRDWNGMMTQKLGNGFEFKKKACFVCGSLYHLIKDCNFYETKMVGKYVLNNKGKATCQRELRPVCNNAKRVNHQNFPNNLSHPHPRRNFVPIAVITNSGKVQVNAAKQSSPRAAASTSTARYVNIPANLPIVNDLTFWLLALDYLIFEGVFDMVKTVNDDVRIQALVDVKKVVVNEASIRRDLRLDYAKGTACLPNAAIFEELARMRVLSLEQTKTNQAAKIEKLKKRVKKPEGKKKMRTHWLKRLYKGRMNDQDLFGLHDLDGDEVFVDVTTAEHVEQDATIAEKQVTTIEDIKVVDVAITTLQIYKDELTLAQTLMKIKVAKPKTKGVIIQEPSEFRTTSLLQPPQAKDKEVARKLEVEMKAEIDEEERIAREKNEANITMIKE
uniref:Ribonuclease H-like domain-containing protein n=1 Tax=Tanacetum cinerariifolium TaxID=118510 RepID=A0A6L2NR10_TANCI|nr:ribonuclease H-like domain-containing protein [Tanacetum cinerariifolium]